MRLRTKTSLLMAFLVTVALGTSGLFYLNFLKDSLRDSIFSGLEGVSTTSSEAVSRFLDACLRETRMVASALPVDAIERRDAAAIEAQFKSFLGAFPDFENGMFILGTDGELWVDYPANPALRGKPYGFREYFQRTMKEGKGIVGAPYISSRINEPVLTFTAPLRDRSNAIIGVLGCSVRLLSAQTAQVLRSTRIGNSGYIYIYDKSRMMILHPERERVLQRDVPTSVNRLFDAAINEGFQGVGETVNSRGIPMLAAVSQIRGTDWILVAQQPKEEAYAPIRKATKRILWGLFVAMAASVLVTALAVRRATAPILRLRDQAVQFKQLVGETEVPACLPDKSLPLVWAPGDGARDEIGELSLAFKDMAERLLETLCSLKRASADWKDTFDSVPDAIWLVDERQRVLRLNRQAAAVFGVDPEKALGQPCYRLMHKTDAPPPYCPHERTITTGELSALEVESPSNRYFMIATSPRREKEGDITGAIHVAGDITERRQVEQTLKKTKDMLEALIQAAPVAINVADQSGSILMWNPASEEIFGWREDEVLGRFHPLIPDEGREEFLEMLRSTQEGKVIRNAEARRRKKDGTLIDVNVSTAPLHDASGRVIGTLGILVDVTERKRAEAERAQFEAHLRQAYKMEAIGTLAGGIAHDFNNILSAILGYTELSLHGLPEGSRIGKNLEQVLKAGLRAKDLVRQILAFSRKSETETQPIRVSPVVQEALKLLRASLPATIAIRESIAEEPGAVMADPTQIHQVIMNLCTNAAHAMREKGGLLEVSLDRAEPASSAEPNLPGLAAGGYLRLAVRDTGHGMDAQTMERIFDPYFTTKAKELGTGLGLTVVRGIVRSYGGDIRVESEPGVGTTFHVFLPLVELAASARADDAEELSPGNARILFVDDEVALAELGKQMLEHLGYTVTAQTSSLEALETFRANPRAFDLVITDTTMPNMTGLEMAVEMLRLRADVPIILCTGFSEIVTPEKARAMGIRELLIKPLSLRELSRTIHKVFRGPSS